MASTATTDFRYPEEWNNDQRMDVMFAPFRQKARYPKAWEQKMKFWTTIIQQRLFSDGEIIVDVNRLAEKFKRKDRMPACFGDVMSEIILNGNGELQLSRLSDITDQSSWLAWGYRVLSRRLVMWGLGSQTVDGLYVVTPLLKSKSEKLLETLHTQHSHSCLIHYTTLRDLVHEFILTDKDFDLVLSHLSQQHKICMHTARDGTVLIKFAEKGEEKVNPVQKSDTEVIKIEQTIETLENEIDALQKSITRYTEDAREYIRRGLKTTAYHTVRKRKRAQKLTENKYKTIDILHGLLERLQNSASDKMVLDAYTAGTAILHTYLQENHMTVDRVDDILDNLQQVSEECDELNETLSAYSSPTKEIESDADLLAELDRLVTADTDASVNLSRDNNTTRDNIQPTTDTDLLEELNKLNVEQSSAFNEKRRDVTPKTRDRTTSHKQLVNIRDFHEPVNTRDFLHTDSSRAIAQTAHDSHTTSPVSHTEYTAQSTPITFDFDMPHDVDLSKELYDLDLSRDLSVPCGVDVSRDMDASRDRDLANQLAALNSCDIADLLPDVPTTTPWEKSPKVATKLPAT